VSQCQNVRLKFLILNKRHLKIHNVKGPTDTVRVTCSVPIVQAWGQHGSLSPTQCTPRTYVPLTHPKLKFA